MKYLRERMSDEAKLHVQFANKGFPVPTMLNVDIMRSRNENFHALLNKKLNGKFNGILKQALVPTKTDGIVKRVDLLEFASFILEIPITVYTPTGVTNDKLVVYYHGGGRINSLFLFYSIIC